MPDSSHTPGQSGLNIDRVGGQTAERSYLTELLRNPWTRLSVALAGGIGLLMTLPGVGPLWGNTANAESGQLHEPQHGPVIDDVHHLVMDITSTGLVSPTGGLPPNWNTLWQTYSGDDGVAVNPGKLNGISEQTDSIDAQATYPFCTFVSNTGRQVEIREQMNLRQMQVVFTFPATTTQQSVRLLSSGLPWQIGAGLAYNPRSYSNLAASVPFTQATVDDQSSQLVSRGIAGNTLQLTVQPLQEPGFITVTIPLPDGYVPEAFAPDAYVPLLSFFASIGQPGAFNGCGGPLAAPRIDSSLGASQNTVTSGGWVTFTTQITNYGERPATPIHSFFNPAASDPNVHIGGFRSIPAANGWNCTRAPGEPIDCQNSFFMPGVASVRFALQLENSGDSTGVMTLTQQVDPAQDSAWERAWLGLEPYTWVAVDVTQDDGTSTRIYLPVVVKANN